jgi:L-alanine-DL-glutamate epimerase-like enolase superfamily enzyme
VGHGWNTAVGLAADLQLAAALPSAELVEFIGGSPYIDEIVETPWALDEDGMLAIPESPGLGVRLDLDALGAMSDNRDAMAILGRG